MNKTKLVFWIFYFCPTFPSLGISFCNFSTNWERLCICTRKHANMYICTHAHTKQQFNCIFFLTILLLLHPNHKIAPTTLFCIWIHGLVNTVWFRKQAHGRIEFNQRPFRWLIYIFLLTRVCAGARGDRGVSGYRID